MTGDARGEVPDQPRGEFARVRLEHAGRSRGVASDVVERILDDLAADGEQ